MNNDKLILHISLIDMLTQKPFELKISSKMDPTMSITEGEVISGKILLEMKIKIISITC